MSDLAPEKPPESFEDRVRAVIRQEMADPTRYHPNFKAWVPKYIETQGVQLPISQITGAYITETSTTTLGGDVHGRIGMVRGGSTPYDFTQVTFDKVYGKWVSSPVPVFSSFFTAAFTTASTTYVQVQPPFVESYINYRTFDTSSLAPQLRIIARMKTSSGAQTASVSMWFATADSGSALSATTNASWAATTSSTAATGVIADSGWNDIPSLTLADFMYFSPIAKSSSGAATTTVFGHQGHLRWVSK